MHCAQIHHATTKRKFRVWLEAPVVDRPVSEDGRATDKRLLPRECRESVRLLSSCHPYLNAKGIYWQYLMQLSGLAPPALVPESEPSLLLPCLQRCACMCRGHLTMECCGCICVSKKMVVPFRGCVDEWVLFQSCLSRELATCATYRGRVYPISCMQNHMSTIVRA